MYSHAKANGWKNMIAITKVGTLVVVVIMLAAAGIAYFAFYGGGGNATTTTTGAQHGLLSVLISDPPHLPDGVSALYVTYQNMYLHLAGVPEADGWIQVSSSGSIQLLGAVNIGETVAFASMPADEYNMIRFNVSSATATYNNQNYSALVQNGNLTIHFIDVLSIDPTQPSALVVDVSPFVVNFGAITNPSFVLKPSAISFSAPQGFATQQMQHIGYRFQFQANHTWFWQYRNSFGPQVNITSATLSNTSLTLVVNDSGSESLTINAITLSSLQGTSMGHGFRSDSMPSGLSGSAVFLVNSSGDLTQLTRQEYGTGPMELSTMIWGSEGYSLAPGASTLSYSGAIVLSLRMPPYTQPGEIVPGQQYMISLMGDGVCSSYVVTAN
ncbi:MAG: DUF4382 domain-containing protein [Nitrososphaerota archaeon]|nr:DUF4382 domain-containing protein [Nitrososphaerota archaeon]